METCTLIVGSGPITYYYPHSGVTCIEVLEEDFRIHIKGTHAPHRHRLDDRLAVIIKGPHKEETPDYYHSFSPIEKGRHLVKLFMTTTNQM
jgi:hypothetical protein